MNTSSETMSLTEEGTLNEFVCQAWNRRNKCAAKFVSMEIQDHLDEKLYHFIDG